MLMLSVRMHWTFLAFALCSLTACTVTYASLHQQLPLSVPLVINKYDGAPRAGPGAEPRGKLVRCCRGGSTASTGTATSTRSSSSSSTRTGTRTGNVPKERHQFGKVSVKIGRRSINKIYLSSVSAVVLYSLLQCLRHAMLPYAKLWFAQQAAAPLQTLIADSNAESSFYGLLLRSITLRPQDHILSPSQQIAVIKAVGTFIIAVWAFLVIEFYICKQFALVEWLLHYSESRTTAGTSLLISLPQHERVSNNPKTFFARLFDKHSASIALVDSEFSKDVSNVGNEASPVKSIRNCLELIPSKRGKLKKRASAPYYDWMCKATVGSKSVFVGRRSNGTESECYTVIPCWQLIDKDLNFNKIHQSLKANMLNGLTTKEASQRLLMFGENSLHFDRPTAQSLLYRKVSSPYFVCQLGLQFMGFVEEGVLQPLIGVLVGVLFEAWGCMRQAFTLYRYIAIAQNLTVVSAVTEAPCLYVLRRDSAHSSHWRPTSPNALVPGDIISLTCQQQANNASGLPVPADCLILSGGLAVVDEASLTGESVPVTKLTIAQASLELSKVALDETTHKDHILFTGTILLKSKAGAAVSPASALYDAPGDLVCLVLRTGTSSTMGQLMSQITSSTTGTGVDNVDIMTAVYENPQSQTESKKSRPAMARSMASDITKTLSILVTTAIGMSTYIAYCDSATTSGASSTTRALSVATSAAQAAKAQLRVMLRISRLLARVIPSDLHNELNYHVGTISRSVPNVVVLREEALSSSGLVTTCLFDKTGTICADSLSVVQILRYCPTAATATLEEHMANAHALTNNQQSGDPLELCIVRCLQGSNRLTSKAVYIREDIDLPGRRWIVHGHKSYISQLTNPFDAVLQRMSSCWQRNDSDASSNKGWTVSCKGSPESILKCLHSAQSSNTTFKAWYLKTYTKLALEGKRVIAYASKNISCQQYQRYGRSSSSSRKRKSMESDLTFTGFVCLSSPVRADSTEVIRNLTQANIDTKIVSGDSLATCCHVAQTVGLFACQSIVVQSAATTSVLALRLVDQTELVVLNTFNCAGNPRKHKEHLHLNGEVLAWTTLEGKVVSTYRPPSDASINLDIDGWSAADVRERGAIPVVEGPAVTRLLQIEESGKTCISDEFKHFKIFARCDPRGKERVVLMLQRREIVMFVGDGTNDMIALAASDVGIAIPNADVVAPKSQLNTVIGETSSSSGKQQPLGGIAMVAHFASSRASISSAIDVIRYGRLSHGIYLLNNMVALVEPLVAGYMMTRGYRFRLSGAHNTWLSPLSMALNLALCKIKPESTLLPMFASLQKRSVLTPHFLALGGVQVFMQAVVIDRVFKNQNSLEPSTQQLFANGNRLFPFLLAQFPVSIVSNFIGPPLMKALLSDQPLLAMVVWLPMALSIANAEPTMRIVQLAFLVMPFLVQYLFVRIYNT